MELLILYKGMLAFGAVVLAAVAAVVRLHVRWVKEDGEKRKRGM